MFGCGTAKSEKLTAKIHSVKTIAMQQGRYMGWPTIAKLPDGRLMVVFSGDRDWHVCPWGKTQAVVSNDNGVSWSGITTINNTPLDDRDAGLTVSDKGTLILSWFTSIAFADKQNANYKDRYSQYDAHWQKITAETKQQWLSHDGTGYWVRRSTDGGKTWQEYIRTPGNSPHGPIQLKDGRLLYVTKNEVSQSSDDGLSWQIIGQIPVDKANLRNEYLWHQQLFGKHADDSLGYLYLDEVHCVEAQDGTIIALSRYQGKGANKSDRYLRQSQSTDGGKTWTQPQKTQMLGYPPHLLKMRNGWILATYGRRVAPMGQRACVSTDNGRTWNTESEFTLCTAAPQPAADLGYPSTVELDDGTLYTVYYQKPEDSDTPAIMATHWEIKPL